MIEKQHPPNQCPVAYIIGQLLFQDYLTIQEFGVLKGKLTARLVPFQFDGDDDVLISAPTPQP